MSEIGPKRPLFQRSPILAGFGIAAFVSAAFLIGLSLWTQVGGKSQEPAKGPVGLLPESANPPASPVPPPLIAPPNPTTTQQAAIPVPIRAEPPVNNQPRLPEVPIVEEPAPQATPPIEPAKRPERTVQPADTPKITRTAAPKQPHESEKPTRKKPTQIRQKSQKPPQKARTASLQKLPDTDAGGQWRVLMGTFKSRDHASLLVHSLSTHGIAVEMLTQRAADGTDWYLVASGNYATRDKAAQVAKKARTSDGVPTLIRRAAQKG